MIVCPEETLKNLFQQHLKVHFIIENLTRHFPIEVLKALLQIKPGSETEPEWTEQLTHVLKKTTSACQITTQFLEEDNFNIYITLTVNGVQKNCTFNKHFFTSSEYQAIKELTQALEGFLSAGAYIKRGEKQQPVNTFTEVVEWLMTEARRGLQIQRYKGLGEMNPTQLWETTMNSETRNLLRVRIEDAVASDEIFTTLMGDQVEPRRDFIEKNALYVTNLDT